MTIGAVLLACGAIVAVILVAVVAYTLGHKKGLAYAVESVRRQVAEQAEDGSSGHV